MAKKPVALLKCKFSPMVRVSLPLAGVSPWHSAGGTDLPEGQPSTLKSCKGERQDRSQPNAWPGRHQAASRHRVMNAQVEKRCTVDLILTFP